MAPPVVLGCCKNLGYLIYRVGVNESYDYETSDRTSPLSVTRRSQPKPQRRRLACNMVASHRFKRLDLNHLHLNAVMQNNQNSKSKEKENERDAPQSTVKSTPLDRQKHQYAPHREYQLHRQGHHHAAHMAQQPQAQHEPFQPSLGPANNHSPKDPNPRLAVGMDQTRHMAAATQGASELKSLHQKVNNLSL